MVAFIYSIFRSIQFDQSQNCAGTVGSGKAPSGGSNWCTVHLDFAELQVRSRCIPVEIETFGCIDRCCRTYPGAGRSPPESGDHTSITDFSGLLMGNSQAGTGGDQRSFVPGADSYTC